MEGLGLTHHQGVGRQRAARHRAEDHVGVDGQRFGRELVVLEAFLGHVIGFHDLVDVDIEIVIRAFQGMPQREQIGLGGAAGKRGTTDAYAVAARFDRSQILRNARPTGFVRMNAQFDLVAKELARGLEGFMHLARIGRSRGILETDAGERHAGIENLPQGVGVELGIVRTGTAARQFHHGDDDFVLKPRIDNALAGVDQVIDVIQGIEVTNARHAVLFEHFGMQIDHVGRLLLERNDVNPPRQRLQTNVRTNRLAEGVHHVEGRFTAIQERRLKTRATTGFKVGDTRRHRRFYRRDEILGECPRSENRLKSVAEAGVLEQYLLGHDALDWNGIRTGL